MKYGKQQMQDLPIKRLLPLAVALAIVSVGVGSLLSGLLHHRTRKQALAEQKAVFQEELDGLQAEKLAVEEKVESLLVQLEAEKARNEEVETPEEVERPWNLVLVNACHEMEKGYRPALAEIEDGYEVDKRIADDAKRMLQDAKEQGLQIIICSAYRSVERQEQLFQESVQECVDSGMSYWDAYEQTKLSLALPGTSEHALGLALDLVSNQYSELDEQQAETAEAQWLKENCYKYGFILRYPPEKTDITGIIYEPWHYRYVGIEAATEIMTQGITLEEYLDEVH